MISLKINNKSFDKEIFNKTEVNILDGSFVGIKGPSGSGKTTLLKMIGMLESFDGNYYLDNKEVTNKKKELSRIKSFSYVFQKPFLIPYLNVYENIIMPLKNSKEKVDKNQILSMMEKFDILSLEKRKISDLSGGEASRVSMIRALASRRPYMLVDEPTGALDPTNAKIMMDNLMRINKEFNTTIVMVTHSNDFDSYFSQILYLEDKKVVIK